MSRPDSAASAALDADVIRPVFFAELDFVGDPLRANTSGQSVQITGTGTDLDGKVFDGISADLVEISPVRNKDGGSETVTARLSGIVGLDQELLAIIGDPAKWQGRPARLWRLIRDAFGTQQGAIQHYYTGYMVALKIGGSPASQTIEVSIETYLAAFAQASNRSYLDQELFDPGDLSARAAVAIANGVSGNPLVSNTPTPGNGAGAGGGGGLYTYRQFE